MSADKMIEMVKNKTLVRAVVELWLDRDIEDNEAKLLEEMMALVIDHGPDSPSAQATISAAQAGQDVLRSVEDGVQQINEKHGGAIEGLAKILQTDSRSEAEIVAEYLATNKRLPGFGHRLYKDSDPRASYLFDRAKEFGLSSKYIDRVKNLERQLEQQKGKRLVINVDGAMAAVLSEIGIAPELCNAFFVWPRVAGLVYRWKLNRNEKP